MRLGRWAHGDGALAARLSRGIADLIAGGELRPGDRLSAERAYALGLVEELVAPDDLLPTSEQICRDITMNSPHAVSLSQQAVWSSVEMPYSQAVEYSYGLVKSNWQHPDFLEGPRAFAEKRPPKWTT